MSDIKSVQSLISFSVQSTFEHQSNVLAELAEKIDVEQYQKSIDLITSAKKNGGKVVISGMGKSGIVGRKAAASLSSITVPSHYIHPGEAYHGDLGMIQPNDVVILISNSGETDEILKITAAIKRHKKNPIIAITCKETSTLAKESDAILLLHVDRESCPNNLAPTASTTATIAIGDALVCTLVKVLGITPTDFAVNHPGGSLGRRLLTSVKDVMVTDNLPIASPSDTIKDALSIHSKSDVRGFSIVIDDNKLVGCFTDGDIRRALENECSINTPLLDVMDKGCITIDVNAMADDALALLDANNINHLVVTEYDNLVVGVYARGS